MNIAIMPSHTAVLLCPSYHRILFFLLFLITFLSSHCIAYNSTDNSPISLRFHQAPIHTILQTLAEHNHQNLVIGEGIEGNLTIQLKEVPWNQAFDTILKLANLDAEQHGSILFILPKATTLLQKQLQYETELRFMQQQPLTMIKIYPKYADVMTLTEMLNQQKGSVLSERSIVITTAHKNLITIHDLPQNRTAIRQLVQEWDTPPKQIQITANIVSLSENGLKELGIDWGLDTTKPSANNFNIQLSAPSALFRAGMQVARINRRILALSLTALESENQAHVLATPKLLTLNNHKALIKQGTEIPYETSSSNDSSGTTEFKSATLGLEVTPRILPNKRVELDLLITQNTPGRAIKRNNGGEALTIDTQEIKTRVVVEHAETLVLGGIFQYSSFKNRESVPLLKKIPLLGSLFQRESQKRSKNELLIFITPTILE